MIDEFPKTRPGFTPLAHACCHDHGYCPVPCCEEGCWVKPFTLGVLGGGLCPRGDEFVPYGRRAHKCPEPMSAHLQIAYLLILGKSKGSSLYLCHPSHDRQNVSGLFISDCTCKPTVYGLSFWVVQLSHVLLAYMWSLK